MLRLVEFGEHPRKRGKILTPRGGELDNDRPLARLAQDEEPGGTGGEAGGRGRLGVRTTEMVLQVRA
jgi:hypothetical protein